MKRILALLIAVIMVASFVSCGNQKNSESKTAPTETERVRTEAEIVDQMIAEIGTVTAESGQVIENAESAFEKLPEDQKQLVENKDMLEAARKEFDALPFQEFAQKLFTACAHIFKKPLTIEMEDAWYMIDSMGRYKFTFHFKVANGVGIVEDVYYGNGILPFHDLTDEEISHAEYNASVGIGSEFIENGIEAMQQGEPLDAQKIQEYFMKNYK